MALTDVHDAPPHKEMDLEGCSANPKGRGKDRYSANGYNRNSVTMLAAAFGPDFQAATAPAPPPPKEIFRTFGDPAPLGLCAYALTTFLLSLVNLNAGGVHSMGVVVGLFYTYAGAIQVLAGMWEMARGNTFAATAFASYGGFWISLGMIDSSNSPNSYGIIEGYGTNTKELNTALGFYLMAWFMFTTICLLCTLRSNLAFFSLFFFLDITYLLLAISHFDTVDNQVNIPIQKAGGIAGLISSMFAWWTAMAGLINKENSFFTIPVCDFPWSDKVRQERMEYRSD